MSNEREPTRRDWHYITTTTADEAIKIQGKLQLQPGQKARIHEVSSTEFEIWITDN